ncbi:CPBP family intramembrane glutamic endopeptidase [Ignavigranum ruoffiae]|uniref:CPBP family intramembrane glutamic endopeptidase n=1 Tax=Ignavigranum ruoffiae TaxID=89093 RepID=UPI002354B6B0|nr:CPBP family intramembrane glutamic endopeptidase [Ignavigranum ruoffiae]
MKIRESLQPLKQVWSDRVKGSWWKSIVIIISYLLLRIKFETMALNKGIELSGDQVVLTDLQDPMKVMYYMGQSGWYYHLSTFALLAFLFLMLYLFKFKIFDLKQIKVPLLGWTVLTFIAFFALGMVFSVAVSYFAPDYQAPMNQQAVEALVKEMSGLGVFLNIVIMTPITEEILLRGLVMKYLFPLMPVVGALVSAVVFAMLHMPANIIDFFLYFILSAGLTYVYWRTRKIEYPILYHMIQNFLGFLQF